MQTILNAYKDLFNEHLNEHLTKNPDIKDKMIRDFNNLIQGHADTGNTNDEFKMIDLFTEQFLQQLTEQYKEKKPFSNQENTQEDKPNATEFGLNAEQIATNIKKAQSDIANITSNIAEEQRKIDVLYSKLIEDISFSGDKDAIFETKRQIFKIEQNIETFKKVRMANLRHIEELWKLEKNIKSKQKDSLANKNLQRNLILKTIKMEQKKIFMQSNQINDKLIKFKNSFNDNSKSTGIQKELDKYEGTIQEDIKKSFKSYAMKCHHLYNQLEAVKTRIQDGFDYDEYISGTNLIIDSIEFPIIQN